MARHDCVRRIRIRDSGILIRFCCYILLFVAKFVATSSSIEQLPLPVTRPYTYQEPSATHLEQIPHFDYYYYHQSQQQQQQQPSPHLPPPPTTKSSHQPNPAFILTENFNTLNPYQATTTTPLPTISTDAITAIAATTTTTNTDANNVLYHKKDTTSRPPFVDLSLPTTITTTINDDIESINSKDHDHDHYSDVDLREPQPPTNKCEFWLVSDEGNLTSFGDYSQNVDCVYRVAPLNPTVCSLELHFDDFDVDDQRSENDGHGHGASNVEKEFEQLSATPDSCVDNYLEFNNHKRYCRRDWKNRMDIVEIDPNYEKDFMFRLVLDRQTHHSGFNIRYKPLFDTCRSLPKRIDKLKDSDSTLYPVQVSSPGSVNNVCEQRHDALEFEIKSPNYPKNYSNNLDCVYYVIRTADDVCGLELKFLHFDVEQSEGCAYDFFEIDGESFCGHLPNGSRNIFRFDGNIKAISFQTDSQMNAGGFWIKIRQVTDCSNAFLPASGNSPNVGSRMQKCSLVWHERNGQLSSLKYPEPYPNDLLCAYTIEANPGGHYCGLEIHFLNFDLQQSKDCQADFFELDQQRYCGRALHQARKMVRFNQDGFTRFLFKSDSLESRPGFLLNYTQTPCKDMDGVDQDLDESKLPIDIGQERLVQVREPCLQVFQEKRFEMVSDQVDGHYKDNQNCRFTIKKHSPKVCYLEMHFKMFDLEASADCQYDFMEIGNAVRLCGTLNQETSRIYVFDKPEMVITFHSDSTNERKGYLIDVEQLECEGDRIVRDPAHTAEDGGLGEGLQSLEQYRFEQQHQQRHEQQEYQGQAPNGTTATVDLRQQTQQQQQQENFVQQSSEFDPTTISSRKKHLIQPSSLLCSKTYQEREFFIHSPGFPGNYPTDLDCLYMILPFSADVCKLEINFDQFQLQPYDFEKNCLKSDFLDFDNKEQFCGKLPDAQTRLYPMHSNETYFIHFHSDSFRTSFDKGFRLYLRQLECPFSAGTTPTTKSMGGGGGGGFTSHHAQPMQHSPQPSQVHCSRIFMSPSFDIHSPQYPAPYPANTYCDYRVVKFKTPGFNVCFLEVHFVEFDLQTSSHCNKDYVSFNGIKICGQVTRDMVRLFPFYENEFTISFYSDPLINGRGFHLKIRQNECPPTPMLPDNNDVNQRASITKTPSSSSSSLSLSSNNDPFSSYQIYQANQRCQQTFGATYFELESPNYPQYYLPSLGCVFTIQRRHSRFCKLELFVVDFDVEPSTRCVEDYLLVDNVKYCNSNRPPTVLQLPFYEPEKRIYFRSVSFRPRKGFLIQARQIDCDTLITEPKNYLNHNNINPSIQQQQQDIKSRTTMSNAPDTFMDNGHKFIFLPSLPSICEICVTEVTGHIQSYDYPNYYPPNVNCTYRITPLPDNCMAQLQFEEFDFDYSPECNQDYLEINGVRYCGHQLKGVTLLLLNKRKEDLVIRMVTSSRGAMVKPSFRGFRAGYTQLPCIDKHPVPDPSTNAHNQQHQQVPQIMPATKSVSVHPAGPPQGLQVQGGPSGGIATATKTTDKTTTTAAKSDAIYCDQTFDEKTFEIRSPGYPYRYFDDLECSYLIRKNNANVCRLKVTFNYFNVVGEDGNCSGDYLDVFNTRFCGVLDRFSIKEVPFTQEKIMLHFHTNHQQTSNGFHLLVEQVDCISIQPLTDTRLPADGQHQNQPPSGGHQPQPTHPQNHLPQGSMVSKTNQQNQNRNQMMVHHHHQQQQQQPKTSHPVKGDDGGQIRPQTHHQSPSSFKYDDDEIISEFDTRNKATVDSKAQVIYDDKHGDGHGGGRRGSKPGKDRESLQQEQHQQQHEDSPPSPNGLLKNHDHDNGHDHGHDQPKTINTYPLRYYSHNITVKDEDVNNQRAEPLKPTTGMMMMTTIPTFQQPQNTYHPEQQTTDPGIGIGYTVDGDNSADGNRPTTTSTATTTMTTTSSVTVKLCDQGYVEKVFFELKADDLKFSRTGADCQLTIRKAKSNICQLDLMIIRYNLSDTSCSQQYLAIDGERVCGHIHEGTMKRVWFTKPELFLFVKLNQLDHPINDQTFEIKARQVECAANVDVNQLQQQQQQQRREPPSPAMEIQQQQPQQRQPSSSPSSSYPRSRPVEQFPIKGQISIEGRGHHSGPARFPQQSREYQPPPPPSMFEWQTITMRPPFPATPTVGNGYSLKPEVSDPQQQQQSEQPEYDRHCDLIENEKQFKIVSPMDRSQTRCRYTIRKANDKVCAIDIKFEMFRLEDSQKCDREFMEIDSGKICGAFPVGHERRYGFQPNEYEKVIYYTTSKSLNKAGDFKLDVKQVEDCDKPPSTPKPTLTMPTVCDISVRNYRGNIKSPNYPAPYGDYTKCVYRIQAIGDDYCGVQLRLRDIDIEQSNRGKCDKDWLQIDSKKLCGNQLIQTEFMVPFENHLGHKVAQIKFVSDAYGNGRGFDIEYKQEPCARDPNKPTTSLQSPGQKGLSIESRFRPPKIVAVHDDYHHRHQTPSSPSKGGGSSLRPLYPPNYVSKAHMLKTMDRKEFIKMLLLEQEKSKIKMNINHHGSSFVPPATEQQQQQQEEEDSLSSSQTETTTNPSMTTVTSGSSPNASAKPPSPNGNGQSTTINSIAEETVMFTTMPPPAQTNVEGDGSMNTDTTEDQSNLITTEASVTMSDVS